MTREEAIELLKDVIGFVEDNHGRDYDEAFRMAIKALQDRPRGKWLGELKMPDFPRYEWYRCSECRFLSQSVVNYCPNCGAKMALYKGGDSE